MSDKLDSTITISSTDDFSNYHYNSNVIAGNGSGVYFSTSQFNGSSINYTPIGTSVSDPALHVKGTANFESDIIVKGVNLSKLLEDIQKRLSILVPDPEKLEKYEALKKAYDHYKTLEALCEIENKTKE